MSRDSWISLRSLPSTHRKDGERNCGGEHRWEGAGKSGPMYPRCSENLDPFVNNFSAIGAFRETCWCMISSNMVSRISSNFWSHFPAQVRCASTEYIKKLETSEHAEPAVPWRNYELGDFLWLGQDLGSAWDGVQIQFFLGWMCVAYLYQDRWTGWFLLDPFIEAGQPAATTFVLLGIEKFTNLLGIINLL